MCRACDFPAVDVSALGIEVTKNSLLLITDHVLIFASAHEAFRVAGIAPRAKGVWKRCLGDKSSILSSNNVPTKSQQQSQLIRAVSGSIYPILGRGGQPVTPEHLWRRRK